MVFEIFGVLIKTGTLDKKRVVVSTITDITNNPPSKYGFSKIHKITPMYY